MMKALKFIPIALMATVFFSCSEDETEKDTVYPAITMQEGEHFPMNCDTLYIGESFTLRARFTDNRALGSFSIDVHNNFDHHTHSTDISPCPQEADKEPVKPFQYIDQFPIAGGPASYDAELEISVPAGADPGDYHLMVRLTDAQGWQTLKGISVKLAER